MQCKVIIAKHPNKQNLTLKTTQKLFDGFLGDLCI